MGVSAIGETGVRPRTVRLLLVGGLVVLSLLYYFFGPPLTPAVRAAAEDHCNQLAGSDYRSFRLNWELPSRPRWDPPHFSCRDARQLNKAPVSLGWWENPF